MAGSKEYRQLAEEQRRAAASADLPMARLMHKKAADRWDTLAEEFERCESGKAGSARQQQDAS